MAVLTDAILAQLGSAVRKASLVVTHQGQDISEIVTPSLTSLTYRESFRDDQLADIAEIEIADPEAKFRLTHSFKGKQKITLSIILENWNASSTMRKDCGVMYLTAIEITQDKSAGTRIKLTASSINPASSFRLERKSAAWSNTTLKAIAGQIATANQFVLKWTPKDNPAVSRADQHDMSDAFLLKRLCSEHDFSFKIINQNLWIQSNEETEAQAPIGVITAPSPTYIGGLNGSGLINWEYRRDAEDVFRDCTVSVKDPKTGKTVTQSTTDPNQPGPGPKLILHSNVHHGATDEDEDIDPIDF
jgi:hypothetical protein